MALRGPQWENTYWIQTNEEGKDRIHFSDQGVSGGPGISPKKDRKAAKAVRKGKKVTLEQYKTANSTAQGMLFHPATGTGRADDPLISPERRRAAIEGAFGLAPEDIPNIQEVEARMGKEGTVQQAGRRKITKSAAERSRNLAIESIDQSGIPTHEMEQNADKFPQVVATDRSVSDRGGAYYTRLDAAGTRIHVGTSEIQVPGRRATAGGDLVANPRTLPVGRNNTGMHRIGSFLDEQTDGSSRWESMSDEEKDAFTPEGYPEGVTHRHLFTTPGDPEKYYSEEVDSGWTDRYIGDNYVDPDTKYYTRRKATEWEEDPNSTVTKKVTTRVVPPSTMVHEIGHGRHMQGVEDVGRTRREDPLLEGVADGYADAYSRVRGADTRVSDITHNQWGQHHEIEEVGIGTNVPNGRHSYQYSNWTNDTDRALYTAMRHHVQTSGEVPASKYRDETAKTLLEPRPGLSAGGRSDDPEEQARIDDEMRATNSRHRDWSVRDSQVAGSLNALALGRLIHEQPHVMDLFQTGGEARMSGRMQDAGAKALGQYKNLLDRRAAAEGRQPAGPEAGWMATEAGLARHNEAVQSMTLPLTDPQTGKQYDNTIAHSGDPDFPVGGNPVRQKKKR